MEVFFLLSLKKRSKMLAQILVKNLAAIQNVKEFHTPSRKLQKYNKSNTLQYEDKHSYSLWTL